MFVPYHESNPPTEGASGFIFARFSTPKTESINVSSNVVSLAVKRLKNHRDDADTIRSRDAIIDDMIAELSEDFSEPNWNGYKADPLHPQSREFACEFLKVLPRNVVLPVLDPNLNGLLGMYWRGRGYQLLLDISPDGTISYAFKSNNGLAYTGRHSFFHAIPKRLNSLLVDYFSDGHVHSKFKETSVGTILE